MSVVAIPFKFNNILSFYNTLSLAKLVSVSLTLCEITSISKSLGKVIWCISLFLLHCCQPESSIANLAYLKRYIPCKAMSRKENKCLQLHGSIVRVQALLSLGPRQRCVNCPPILIVQHNLISVKLIIIL